MVQKKSLALKETQSCLDEEAVPVTQTWVQIPRGFARSALFSKIRVPFFFFFKEENHIVYFMRFKEIMQSKHLAE